MFLESFSPFCCNICCQCAATYLQCCAPACAVVPLPADISYIVSSEVDCYFVKFAPTHSTHHGWDPCTLPIRASFHWCTFIICGQVFPSAAAITSTPWVKMRAIEHMMPADLKRIPSWVASMTTAFSCSMDQKQKRRWTNNLDMNAIQMKEADRIQQIQNLALALNTHVRLVRS